MSKVALVTGAGRGIGSATAILLAKNGYDVCINYKSNHQQAQKTFESALKYNTRCIVVQADVSKEPEVMNVFSEIDSQLGPITALVNNAGILKKQSRLTDLNAERINHILTTNVTSAFICSREAVDRMSTEQGGTGGSIVNVSSAASRLGAAGEYIDYAASKGAMDSLTTGLSLEVAAEGIRVNSVRPGFIKTEMHADGGEPGRVERVSPVIPMRRGGDAEEIAETIVWLLSDKASYVTGTFIDAAGGR